MFANQLLTSDQWFAYLNGKHKYHLVIMEHAGGWNAHNLHYEWYEEKITLEQFQKRMAGSTRRTIQKSKAKKEGFENYEFHP